jgi:hypothetical protein
MIDGGHEKEFRQMFRLSRNVFESLAQDLSPWIKDGRSKNGRQNVEARVKVGITLYYMAHGGDGINLGCMSGLKNNSALKYLHQVSEAICTHLAPKWMGNGLLNRPGYMDNVRARFNLRNGVANVALCIDGTHIPYKPNSGEHEHDFKNYKQWTSLLCIGFINSLYLFVDLDVGWPGRYHDTTCTKNSAAWTQMHVNSEAWLGRDGIALADSAWGGGSSLVMCPYTVYDGETAAHQWFNFVHSSTRFFVEETYGRWKNRFRFLLKSIEFRNDHTQRLIFASAVLHNMCTLCNDIDDSYFDGSDGKAFGFPEAPLSAYEESFPIDRILCPRCKKKSNGAVTSSVRCNCNVSPLVNSASANFLSRRPNLQRDLISPDPHTRREAYCALHFHTKPKNF